VVAVLVKLKLETVEAVFGIAATIIGTVIGAGFASGREIMEFFGKFGISGGFGILLAVAVMGLFIHKVFRIGSRLQTDSYQEFLRYILKPGWIAVVDFVLFLIMLMLVGVMFAGCGALFDELQWGYWPGVALTATVALLVLFRDLPGLMGINAVVIPLMFLGTVGIVLFTFDNGGAFPEISGQNGYWILAALQFSAYNLVLALPVLISLSRRYARQAALAVGGWMGSVGLGVISLWIFLGLLAHFRLIRQAELPMVVLAKFLGKPAFFGYVLVLWGEMLTTLIANLFGLAKRLETLVHWPFQQNVVLLTGIGIAIGEIGFVNLVAYGYPIYGFLSFFLLVMVMLKPLPGNAG